MIETISLSQLTKKYIDNHDVICEDVHCKYRTLINSYTGNATGSYVVMNSEWFTVFKTLPELKTFIKTVDKSELKIINQEN